MSNEKLKIIFISTSDFGLPALRALHADPAYKLMMVITQPDKKAGRQQALTPPPVKIEALKLGLTVIQPEKIAAVTPEIEKSAPDLIVVVAYAQIIPEQILTIPRLGCINIHASLLPKCRGAACIQGAILSGDRETGVTIMKMDKNLDTGPILAQKSILINDTDTAGILFDKLSILSAELLIPTLKQYARGKILPVSQDEKRKSYFPILNKQDGRIDWTKSAVDLEKFIRAMTPWPGAFSYLDGDNKNILKIAKVNPVPKKHETTQPGKLFSEQNKLFVQCGQDALQIIKLQPAGKKVLSAEEFIRGYSRYFGRTLI